MNRNEIIETWTPRLLSVLRIVAGWLFLQHGAQKLFGIWGMKGGAPVPLMTQMGIGGLLEFVGGILLIVGLLTRPTAFILAGQMAVAYFQFHAPGGNVLLPVENKGESSVLYCFIFLYFAVAGGGAWSLDNLFARRSKSYRTGTGLAVEV